MTGKLLTIILNTPKDAVVVCRTAEERDFMRTRAKLCGRPDISYHTADEKVDFVSASEFAEALWNAEQRDIDDAIAHGERLIEAQQRKNSEA